tara:strand:+ start:469 stop:660 length:192 start_codon:yes stop_codon:yes gene_type:complete
MPIDTYQVTIEDRVNATSYKDALAKTLQRIKTEETVASVEFMPTGQVRHYEIQSGERLDEGDE